MSRSDVRVLFYLHRSHVVRPAPRPVPRHSSTLGVVPDPAWQRPAII